MTQLVMFQDLFTVKEVVPSDRVIDAVRNYMAWFAARGRAVFPSQKHLADKFRVCVRTIQYVLAHLRKIGFIINTKRRASPGKRTAVYSVSMPLKTGDVCTSVCTSGESVSVYREVVEKTVDPIERAAVEANLELFDVAAPMPEKLVERVIEAGTQHGATPFQVAAELCRVARRVEQEPRLKPKTWNWFPVVISNAFRELRRLRKDDPPPLQTLRECEPVIEYSPATPEELAAWEAL